MLFDNAICDRKAQPCTRTNFFRGKKGIEDALLQSLRYTRAGITYGKTYHVSIDFTGDSNNFVRDISHSIASVGEQIDKDLLQLNSVANDYDIFRGKL